MAYEGNPVPLDADEAGSGSKQGAGAASDEIKFGYCTEFVIMLEKKLDKAAELGLKSYLESIGDSIVCVADGDIVKVHVHTNDPGLAIQKGLTLGQLTAMKIDNMREEHNQKVTRESNADDGNGADADNGAAAQNTEQKDVGFVTVAAGDGLAEIFSGLGVDYVIEGGQTMNPSTEDILNAIGKVNARTVFVLPNNKNIILAANQAADISEDKKVIVIGSKTIPQGITAMINYEMGRTIEENVEAMNEGMTNVKTGEITYAVRDTSIDGHEIHTNDIMGLGDSGLLAVSRDVKSTMLQMMSAMVDDSSELVSVYYGSDVRENDAQAMVEELAGMYPKLDIELQRGGQPIYYYVVSVE
jgi:DAK2 domain fusion protein YloV